MSSFCSVRAMCVCVCVWLCVCTRSQVAVTFAVGSEVGLQSSSDFRQMGKPFLMGTVALGEISALSIFFFFSFVSFCLSLLFNCPFFSPLWTILFYFFSLFSFLPLWRPGTR